MASLTFARDDGSVAHRPLESPPAERSFRLAAGELLPSAPFNFDATLHKPDRFSAADDDRQRSAERRRSLLGADDAGVRRTLRRPGVT